MYKAIISDFDGTLSSDRTVSGLVKSSVKELQQKGFIFSIATGKSFQGVIDDACKELDLNAPVIVRGGAEIFNPLTKKVIWAEYLLEKDIRNIISFLKTAQIAFEVNREAYVYTRNDELLTQDSYKIYKPLESLLFNKVAKIRLVTNEKNEAKSSNFVEKILKQQFKRIHVLEIPNGYDITSEKATKHLAVLELSKLINVHPSEMIGIGDGYNDYPLLTAVGFKVVMSTAPQELKEIADLILSESDGVPFVISKLLRNDIN